MRLLLKWTNPAFSAKSLKRSSLSLRNCCGTKRFLWESYVNFSKKFMFDARLCALFL